jgi:hypothetical protein
MARDWLIAPSNKEIWFARELYTSTCGSQCYRTIKLRHSQFEKRSTAVLCFHSWNCHVFPLENTATTACLKQSQVECKKPVNQTMHRRHGITAECHQSKVPRVQRNGETPCELIYEGNATETNGIIFDTMRKSNALSWHTRTSCRGLGGIYNG